MPDPDSAVVDKFDRLRSALEQRCGPRVARLFAEPVLTSGNGAAPARIDWYSDRDGPVVALADMPLDEAPAVRQKAATLLSEVARLLDDPEIGALVGFAMNVSGPHALLSVGGEPVMVDWGVLPAGSAGNEADRLRHHRAALTGPPGVDLPVPPASQAEWNARYHGAGSARAAASSPVAAASVKPVASSRLALVPLPFLAALMLLLSFWPGVLRFPGDVDHSAAEDLATSVADGLRRRQAALATAEELDCDRLEAELPRLVPQAPRAVVSGSGAPDAAPAAVYDPKANAPRPPGTLPAVEASTDLAGRLAASTVLVIAGNGSGSGFFVAPDLVVTNRHVVEGAAEVAIAGPSVSVVRASEVKTGQGGDLGDFALLRVPAQSGIRPLALAMPEAALTPVVSAGFPGLQLETDPVFARLKQGDASAARELSPVFGTGVVNHLQRYGRANVTLVLHGAEIAPGSSGGPLTDYCGRVLGVNTFLRTDASLPVTVRYALGSDGLLSFLRSLGIASSLETSRCDLRGASATTPTAEPAAAGREPSSGSPPSSRPPGR